MQLAEPLAQFAAPLRSAEDTQARASATTSNISALTRASAYARNVARIGVEVADALEHAHRRGIIHRDIKPSNILLDMDGRAWVADFGLAKTESAELTRTGNILGTLRYMSPERFSGSCDARGDVYGIGATLYELLALTPLFESDDQLSLVDSIKNDTPKPLRQVDAKIARDLETIVHKAIEKDPERRYATATLLGADLHRFLDGRPIEARRVGAIERAGLWARNHRLTATLGAVLLLTLIGAAVGGITGAVMYRGLAKQAELQATEAKESAKRSDDALQIVKTAFESVSPESGPAASAVDVLTRMKANLDDSNMDDEGKLSLFRTMSNSLAALGQYELSLEVSEQELALEVEHLGPKHPETLNTMTQVGHALVLLGQVDRGIQLLEEVYSTQQEKLGTDHIDTLASMVVLGRSYHKVARFEEAIELLERAVEASTARYGTEHEGPEFLDTSTLKFDIARAYRKLGRPEALELHSQAYSELSERRGKDHPSTLDATVGLAECYVRQRQYQEAINLIEGALPFFEARLGPQHATTLNAHSVLGDAYSQAAQPDKAIPILRKTLAGYESAYGVDYPGTIIAMGPLADALVTEGEFGEAISLYAEMAARLESALGPEHDYSLRAKNALAKTLYKEGRFEEALGTFEEALKTIEDAANSGDRPTDFELGFKYEMARCCNALGQFDRGRVLREEIVIASGAEHGAETQQTLVDMGNLANSYHLLGDYEQAIALQEQVHARRVSLLGENHPETLQSLKWIGESLRQLDRNDEALERHQAVLTARRLALGGDDVETLSSMHLVGETLLAIGRTEEAEDVLRRCHDGRARAIADEYQLFMTKSLLGECLMKNGKLDEAATMLQAGYEGLTTHQQKIWPIYRRKLLAEAIQRLQGLSELQEDEAAVAKWKRELAELNSGDEADS